MIVSFIVEPVSLCYTNKWKGTNFIWKGGGHELVRAIVSKKGKEPENPKTRAFVDYEHWYYSLKNEYGIKPDVMAWRAELSAKYTLDEILIFGDFSFPGFETNFRSCVISQIPS